MHAATSLPNTGLNDERAHFLVLLHDGFCVLALPEPVRQDLDTSIVHLHPAVEAATLAHGTDPSRAHVVDVVEEHLVPAVATAEAERHTSVEHGPATLRVAGQELVPQVGVVQVRDEHPGQGEAAAAEEGH
eukprot:CAMPEP_0177458250 /NCGR_PEP_ID=MMETSP0369-20130122/13431_1 /TAXON_ID=447022 ORGANISM="Scrippsiella hangoei-like, Strain SHHI-4" /NCGR_SAMPLE_ID=MMETSP0369 /ASSEMBLY_ACC=CAM_ASM_000364 /LENGTH=130 /DNA_ID=CAMNT_0018931357 /DNA_START=456 /DNA_END=848 /DNA_ORIENTATION=+